MKNLQVKPLALAVALGLSPSAFVYAQSERSEVDESQIEEVIVQGVKSADLNARQAERVKDAFSSIVSQDDAGNFADQNVAESLQRLPGITLQKTEGEGRYVNVRGLGADFVSVTMNGSELASGGGDGRAFALDAIPADMLGSVEVYKSLTPDLDLNSIGGSVNVKTVSAFDKKRDTLKLKAQVNNQAFKDQLSPKLSISGTNLLFDERVGVGYSLSSEQRNSVNYEVRHHSTEAPRYITVDDTTALVPFRFENRQEEGERTRNAASLDVGFRPNDNSEYFVRLSHTSYQDLDVALREYYRFGQAKEEEYVFLDTEQRLVGAVGTDLQHQFFIQDGVARTTAFAVGGENHLSDDWHIDYEFATSKGEWDKPGASRAQFRVREVPMVGAWGSNYQLGQVVTGEVMEIISGKENLPRSASYIPDSRQQSKMEYDNIFIEDSFRTDDLSSIKFNVKKDFGEGALNYIKFGALAKARERNRDKDRWSVVPSDKASFGCLVADDPDRCFDLATSTLGDFETFTPAHPDIKHDFITYDATRALLDQTRTVATEFDKSRNDQDSVKDDYVISEDVQNAYLMAEFATTQNSTLIVGAKYESTQYESTGNVSIRFDATEDSTDEDSGDVAVPLNPVKNSYSDFLPSIHWRYEPREDVLVRAALWTSFTRPNFSDSRAQVAFVGRAVLCDLNNPEVCADRPSSFNYAGAVSPEGIAYTPEEVAALNAQADGWMDDEEIKANTFVGSPNTVRIGNPALKAQTATNFDTSITWYASEDLYLQAALFAKQIDGFIVDVRGQAKNLSQIGYDIPTDVVTSTTALNLSENTSFSDVNQAINGDVANVYGLELTYSQYFDSGLFVQSNLTVITSDASLDDSIRVENTALPYQADETMNLTVGWENDDFSVRLISNYRSAVLEQVGACGTQDIASDLARADAEGSDRVIPYECRKWADVYEDNTFGLDFKATWQATDRLSVYFDALNLTEDTSVRYFSGNRDSGGKMMYSSESFGSSFQLGVNVKIM